LFYAKLAGMNILLMEDDAVLSDIILDFLRESWCVDYAYNAEEVYKLLESKSYDMFIFDINVSGKNGLELLEELREFSNTTPTLFITAYRDTTYLKRAFQAGAQDYIKKPFELEELYARVLNTKKLFNIETNNILELSQGISFSPQKKELLKNGKKISLSSIDAKLQECFITIAPTKAKMLINNLLSNAIKYSHPNTKISLTTTADSFTIIDEGIGIKEEKLDTIFKRFVRASKYAGGFGVGLNIVQSILKEYDFKITIDSTLNKGTTIRLLFKE